MNNQLPLLQAVIDFKAFKPAIYSYATAFVVTLICIPLVIGFVKRYHLLDKPNERKLHRNPVPTLGGLAIFAGLVVSMIIWVNFDKYDSFVAFFLSLVLLLGIGIMDDLKDLPARYKLIIEAGLALMIALSGTRITGFGGLFGLYELPVTAQYTITIVAIIGIINAFNLIDGIDGLAGGLGFMSLVSLGIFLMASREINYSLIAFAMAGALLAFLYYNLNPAKIFMGDTGSLILGFVIAILCIHFIKINIRAPRPFVPNVGLFTLGIIIIPVFDAIRVFSTRLWSGRSPFSPDRNHIHHLVTNHGFSHGFAARLICFINGILQFGIYWMRNLRPEFLLLVMLVAMLLIIWILKRSYWLKKILPHSVNTGLEIKSN
ncbi:MAG: undecaprenyl/decaprenyl-phosphate alpha-N-acetylglucosaminyl 1-phosphate transferase [Terrimonas sp.]|nr:undecaprenyl/decaprenyl-phosphate alpha-N-acetylglucosaminyl 1-phosphate transferase [Terrimonas sp.]